MNSSKLVIGMVSCDAPPHIGGMGRHVGELMEGLKQEGMDVCLFDRTQRPVLWKFGKHLGFSLGLRSALQRWIEQEHISVIHLHAGPGGVLLPSGINLPLVVTVHHTYAQQSKLPGERWKRLLMPFERKTYQSADCLICLSQSTRESLMNDYKIPSEKIRIIPGAFDLTPWIASDRDDREKYSCVFVARPEKRKGFDFLMAAWPIVQKDIPEARLSIVGQKQKISDHDLQSLVGSARLVLCPSHFEGFGLAAAEAITAGTPVVATNVPGLLDVVSTKTGIFVNLDPESIATGIIKLLKDDALWDSLHRGCREERSRFDRARAITAHCALYNSLYS